LPSELAGNPFCVSSALRAKLKAAIIWASVEKKPPELGKSEQAAHDDKATSLVKFVGLCAEAKNETSTKKPRSIRFFISVERKVVYNSL
jgi:hypothetical protein